jgi:hypothetical protein
LQAEPACREVNYLMNQGNVNSSVGLKGNPHPTFIFKNYLDNSGESSLFSLLNYLNN